MNSQNSQLKTCSVAVAVVVLLTVMMGPNLIPSSRASSTLTFTTIDPPGSTFTLALDINAPGDIVGNYATADGRGHGFLLSKGTFTTIDVPGAGLLSEANGINDAGVIVGIWGLVTEEPRSFRTIPRARVAAVVKAVDATLTL
jgi:uncharacterized membrane protein